MARIIQIDPAAPSEEHILTAVKTLRFGGVVAYPTETFYGLGVDALNREAVKKIFAAKKRQESQPLLILIPDRSFLPQYARKIPPAAEKLMDCFWPGPLTLVFPATLHLPPELCAGTGTIAIRISPHPVARALVQTFTSAVTSTSANISGQPSPTTAEEVHRQLGESVDLIIDAGRTAGGKPSTIVDATSTRLRVIRKGAVTAEEMQRCY